MTASTARQRRHRVRTECIVRSARDARLLGDRTLDLSYDGARIAALGPARLGERVTMSIALPGTRIWFEAEGRVERIEEGRRRGDEGPALGIRVDRMDGMKRLLLATVLRHHPVMRHGRGDARDYAMSVARIATR